MESESDPLTRRPVDLFEKEPLKGNSEVHLHTPTKFGEDRSKDLGGDREQTDKQTNRQTDKRCSIYSMILFFSGHAIGIANLRNRTTFSHQTSLIYGPLSDDVHKTILVSIQITVLDLEPNPDFRTFLVISKTDHQICKCDTSKRRSGQELPFIFFELRAPTCL